MPEYARAPDWFRRDLRDFDHAALYHALKHARQMACAFVFDREILDSSAATCPNLPRSRKNSSMRRGRCLPVNNEGRTASSGATIPRR